MVPATDNTEDDMKLIGIGVVVLAVALLTLRELSDTMLGRTASVVLIIVSLCCVLTGTLMLAWDELRNPEIGDEHD